MSNGSGLDLDDLEDLVKQMQASFGLPNHMYMSPQAINIMQGFMVKVNPQYEPTGWAEISRLSVREHKVAMLHTILTKLKVIKFDQTEWDIIINNSCKRLRKAKWARYENADKHKQST